MFTTNTIPSGTKIVPNRFDQLRFLEFSDVTQTYDPVSSLFERRLKTLKPKGTYEIKQNSGRPDSVSYAIYGTTALFWVILWYNDLRFFYELKIGQVIQYPDLRDIDKLTRSLSTSEGMWL